MALHGSAEIPRHACVEFDVVCKSGNLGRRLEGFFRVIEPDIPNDEHGPQWLDRKGVSGPMTINVERMVGETGHRSAAYFQNFVAAPVRELVVPR
jgi:hypothetical protein